MPPLCNINICIRKAIKKSIFNSRSCNDERRNQLNFIGSSLVNRKDEYFRGGV